MRSSLPKVSNSSLILKSEEKGDEDHSVNDRTIEDGFLNTEQKSLKLVLSRLSNSKGLGSGSLKTRLSYISTVTTNGSGAYLSALSLDPSSSSEFSSFATLYDEFRVTSVTVQWSPTLTGSATPGSMLFAFDNDSAVAPASQTEVLCYQNFRFDCLGKHIKETYHRPNITQSAYWVDMASSSGSLGSIPFVIGYSNASVVVGQFVITLHTDMRGRR